MSTFKIIAVLMLLPLPAFACGGGDTTSCDPQPPTCGQLLDCTDSTVFSNLEGYIGGGAVNHQWDPEQHLSLGGNASSNVDVKDQTIQSLASGNVAAYTSVEDGPGALWQQAGLSADTFANNPGADTSASGMIVLDARSAGDSPIMENTGTFFAGAMGLPGLAVAETGLQLKSDSMTKTGLIDVHLSGAASALFDANK